MGGHASSSSRGEQASAAGGSSADDNDTGAQPRLPGKVRSFILCLFDSLFVCLFCLFSRLDSALARAAGSSSPVYAYALYNLFSGALLLVYLLFLALYCLVVAAFVVAEISICPPWYSHVSDPRMGLSKHSLPDYWQVFAFCFDSFFFFFFFFFFFLFLFFLKKKKKKKSLQGIVSDPEKEFGLKFENVEFANDVGMILRGWWVPGIGERSDTAVVFCHGGGRDRFALFWFLFCLCVCFVFCLCFVFCVLCFC
jgi:hypothetical protein